MPVLIGKNKTQSLSDNDSSVSDIINEAFDNIELTTIGKLCLDARVSKSLTQEQASALLKVRVKIIKDFENGDQIDLPGTAYKIGFVRSYARLLELDSDLLVKEFKESIEVNNFKEEYKFLSPEINGKNLFEYLISNVKSHIRQLPVSDLNSLEQKVFFQIISNNGFSDYLFKDGPKALTNETKIQALTYLDSLLALEQSPIDPWRDICKSLESEYVGQIVMISAWKPKKNNASINEPCVGNQFGKFSEIVRDYNQFYRSKSATGALIIDSISLYNNFCQKNKNAFNNEWLGSISEGAESICIHIK